MLISSDDYNIGDIVRHYTIQKLRVTFFFFINKWKYTLWKYLNWSDFYIIKKRFQINVVHVLNIIFFKDSRKNV